MHHYEVINGIRGKPKLPNQWWDGATFWLNTETEGKARAFDNRFPAIRTPKRKRKYASALLETLLQYNRKGVVPSIIAHSNGNVIALMSLSYSADVMVDTLYMLFPACWSDFDKNGLNNLLATKQVRRVVFVGSREDKVVKWGGRLTGWLNSFSPFGYGTLSYAGPENVRPVNESKIIAVWKNEWGHNDFASEGNLPYLLKELTSDRSSTHR